MIGVPGTYWFCSKICPIFRVPVTCSRSTACRDGHESGTRKYSTRASRFSTQETTPHRESETRHIMIPPYQVSIVGRQDVPSEFPRTEAQPRATTSRHAVEQQCSRHGARGTVPTYGYKICNLNGERTQIVQRGVQAAEGRASVARGPPTVKRIDAKLNKRYQSSICPTIPGGAGRPTVK